MDNKPNQAKDLEALLQDDAVVGGALRTAARQAIRQHKEEGLPLAMWRDGEVAWVPAEELEAETGDIERGGRLPQEYGGGRRPPRKLLTIGTGMVRRLRRVEAVIIAEHEQGWERATQGSRAPIAAGAK